MFSTKKAKRQKPLYLDPISEIISNSAEPMILFGSNLNIFGINPSIVTANACGKKLLKSCRSVYPVVKESILNAKPVTKKIYFNKKIFLLNSCPIFTNGNVTGALATVRANQIKKEEFIKRSSAYPNVSSIT